ncbi:MAG: extracellular solute-binding protein [Actinocatenispora sp.]
MSNVDRRSLLRAGLGLGALAGIPGLAACSGGSKGSGGGSGPLRYPSWMWTDAGVNKYWNASVQAFTKQSGLDVKKVPIAPNSYADQITTDIAGGRRPDILPVFTNDMFALMDNELLEPLDDQLAGKDWASRELPIYQVAKRHGKTYGVVCTASPQSLVVNQKLMKKAGIEKIPTTIEELYGAVKQVKARTGAWGFTWPMASADYQNCYVSSMQWVLGFGSDWADKNAMPTADAPKTVEAINWMVKFARSGAVPTGMKVVDARALFKDGKVAFMIDGPFLPSFVRAENPSLYPDITMVDSPTPTHAAITGGAFFVMLKGNQRNADVWKYLEMINQESWQRRWVEQTSQLAGQQVQPSQKFLDDNPWVGNLMKTAAKYQTGFGYAPPTPKIAAKATEWQKQVIDSLIPIWNGKGDATRDLKELQQKLEKWEQTNDIHPGS